LQVSEEALDRFIKIHEEEVGAISRVEARALASSILDLFRVTCRPIPGEDWQERDSTELEKS